MLPVRIKNALPRPLAAPDNWDPAQNGHCGGLFIRVDKVDGLQWMRSAWEPSPDEVIHLLAGGKLILGVSGSAHPVVSLGVEPETERMIRTTIVRELRDRDGHLCIAAETLFPPPPGSTEANRARCTVRVGTSGAPHATMTAMGEIEKLAVERGWTA